MTALLDAATLAESLCDGVPCDRDGIADALRLLASHARTSSAELEAWKRLALARGGWRPGPMSQAQIDVEVESGRSLRAIGIDPATGERMAADGSPLDGHGALCPGKGACHMPAEACARALRPILQSGPPPVDIRLTEAELDTIILLMTNLAVVDPMNHTEASALAKIKAARGSR